MSLTWKKYTLRFKQPSGTSRGILRTKDSWFLIYQSDKTAPAVIGECSIIDGLSPDPIDNFELKLDEVCQSEGLGSNVNLSEYPSISFGLEMIKSQISKKSNSNKFQQGKDGILINGLIWMGELDFMKEQIKVKVKDGFKCIKIKIGAIDFESELGLLRWIRSEYAEHELELRVDANGAFSPSDAIEKLNRLSQFGLHSIEQPIAPNQWEEMAKLCANTPIPIALDEELIGLDENEIVRMMDNIKPQYIILKPSLIGGLEKSDMIIHHAEKKNIGWWLTSALESNIGLHSIAQYAYGKNVSMPQGLGTGGLYINNLDSPLYIQGQFLFMHPENKWNLKPLLS